MSPSAADKSCPSLSLLFLDLFVICYKLFLKSDLCIFRDELCGLVPNSYIHVSLSDLYMYSQDRSAYLAAAK